MLARVSSAAIWGVEALPLEVEIDVQKGLPCMVVGGLPDAAVREARDRVRSALVNSGFEFPVRRITANLAPAHLPKTGSMYDLPLALGILAATALDEKQEHGRAAEAAGEALVVGELALDGRVRPVRGLVAMAILARQHGVRRLICPRAGAQEVAWLEGVEVAPVESLHEAWEVYLGRRKTERPRAPDVAAVAANDFGEVRGQTAVKRALAVAAAGGHNVLLVGPPGAGKSMLAARLPGILPPLSLAESLEVTRIHSVVGELAGGGLMASRPFRSPHHSASMGSLLGGSKGLRPGEVSLAHRGVLFLDELPEFRRDALEALRQPLESGSITVNRVHGGVSFPARFMLVAAMNPCPCGYDGSSQRPCRCSGEAAQRYRNRISGPLLDRFDLQLLLSPVPLELLSTRSTALSAPEASTAGMRERVAAARQRQRRRYGDDCCNADLAGKAIARHCALDVEGDALLLDAARRFHLSARSFARIAKLARSIADIEDREAIASEHVAEALQYRLLDRIWGY